MQLSKVFYPCGEIFIPSFYRIPRPLFFQQEFVKLSNDAKLLYSLLLDRLSLSMSNQWFDDVGRIYIYYTVSEVQFMLSCAKQKALQLLSELERAGLIERKRQGLCKPDMMYVNLLPDIESYCVHRE